MHVSLGFPFLSSGSALRVRWLGSALGARWLGSTLGARWLGSTLGVRWLTQFFLFGNSCHSTSGGHSTGPYESSGEGDSQKMC